ncbi:MAG: hypothetical protein HRT66_05025, partial [Flavobacteriaceae bacterium]|nr:hypothetical protein [Flavobacteriaceae bacterium]
MDKGPKERSMKINIKSQLSISYSSIIIIVLGAVIISYFYNYLSKDDSIYIAYVWCLIDVIPVIILHIIYYIRNNKEEYTLKANGIEYKKDSVTVFYNSYDISKIVIYL